MLQLQSTTGTLTSGVASVTSSSPGIRLRATSFTTGDGFQHYLWSSGMLFTAGSIDPPSTDTLHDLHPGVCAYGSHTNPANDLTVVNTMGVFVFIQSLDLLVIQSSFEDYSVIWMLNI